MSGPHLRGRCAECGDEVTVNADGRPRRHHGEDGTSCPGVDRQALTLDASEVRLARVGEYLDHLQVLKGGPVEHTRVEEPAPAVAAPAAGEELDDCTHGLDPRTCSTCLHGLTPLPASETVTRRLTARYPGTCPECHEDIVTGDALAVTTRNRYLHDECADDLEAAR